MGFLIFILILAVFLAKFVQWDNNGNLKKLLESINKNKNVHYTPTIKSGENSVAPINFYSQSRIKKEIFKEIEMPVRKTKQPPFLSACYKINEPNNYEGYFKNGELYDVNPRDKRIPLYENRDIAYHARYIISDGVKYDLENPDSIKSMKIPVFNKINGMPNTTSDLGYIMKMKANSENRPELAVPLVYKAANLMMASPISWLKKDYYMIIKHLWLIGEIEYADYLLTELQKRLPFMTDNDYFKKIAFQKLFAEDIDSDLVEVGVIGCTCDECAKLQGRVYSISGLNPNFPKLPQQIIENYGTHCENPLYCRSLYGNEEDMEIQIYKYDKNGECHSVNVNAISYSNRPFTDNRTVFEKQRYKHWVADKEKRKKAEERYYSREYWIREYNKHFEYQQIVNVMGEKAPKSLGGYTRMKNQNTKNFQKILKAAEDNNIKIN